MAEFDITTAPTVIPPPLSVVINQPYLFPQLHWWHRSVHCDNIILLDDVQHNKNFPINRLLAFDGKNPKYITININKNQKREIIYKMITHETFSKQSIYNKFIEYYKSCPYFNESKIILDEWLSQKDTKKVLELVLSSIDICAKYLDIDLTYKLSSLLDTKTFKNQRLIDLCNKVNSKKLILGLGSKNYVDPEIELYKNNNIEITYQDWNCPIDNYSILDSIARYGIEKTKEILEI